MKRTYTIIILLCVAAAAAFLVALPYFFPDPSALECRRITDSFIRDDCYSSVAIIKGEEDLCRYSSDYLSDCRKKAKADNVTSLKLQASTYKDDYYYRNSDYNDPLLRCAVDGLIKTRYSYSAPFFQDSPVSYNDVEFAGNCESLLKGANESICNETYYSYYEEGRCISNIRLAKGLSKENVCQMEDRNYCFDYYDDYYALYHGKASECERDECLLAFAIRNNDPSLCMDLYPSSDCLTYFALKDSDINYCDKYNLLDSYYYSSSFLNNTRHYCRAMVLAFGED